MLIWQRAAVEERVAVNWLMVWINRERERRICYSCVHQAQQKQQQQQRTEEER